MLHEIENKSWILLTSVVLSEWHSTDVGAMVMSSFSEEPGRGCLDTYPYPRCTVSLVTTAIASEPPISTNTVIISELQSLL